MQKPKGKSSDPSMNSPSRRDLMKGAGAVALAGIISRTPGYAAEAAWKNESERGEFIQTNGLRFLRPYQKTAIFAIQQAVGIDEIIRILSELRILRREEGRILILGRPCGAAGVEAARP